MLLAPLVVKVQARDPASTSQMFLQEILTWKEQGEELGTCRLYSLASEVKFLSSNIIGAKLLLPRSENH